MKIQFVPRHHHGNMPAIEVTDASKQFHEFISGIIGANRLDDPDYIAKSYGKPFFQGGYDFDNSHGWILIECWSAAEEAEKFYQYVMEKWNAASNTLIPITLSWRKQEKDYHSTLNIFVTTAVDVEDIKIEFISSGRSATSYEIFDSENKSLSDRYFSCDFGPVSGTILKKLVDDLNVIFEIYGFHMDYHTFKDISNLAVGKCESRYGNSIDGGDCNIFISKGSM